MVPDGVTDEVTDGSRVDQTLRASAPGVLARLAARYGQWEACEDAVQEAVVDALRQWPVDGVPADPRGWLTTVARRALVDAWRSDSSRRRREEVVAGSGRHASSGVAPQSSIVRQRRGPTIRVVVARAAAPTSTERTDESVKPLTAV